MQNRIEEHLDYESIIRDYPLELLIKIKVLMHDPIRAKYPFASPTEAITRILNIRQMENEGLLEYVKRFKESRDIMKTHIGTDILDKFVENTKDYQDEIDVTKRKDGIPAHPIKRSKQVRIFNDRTRITILHGE